VAKKLVQIALSRAIPRRGSRKNQLSPASSPPWGPESPSCLWALEGADRRGLEVEEGAGRELDGQRLDAR
jgi:hypothetical protein